MRTQNQMELDVAAAAAAPQYLFLCMFYFAWACMWGCTSITHSLQQQYGCTKQYNHSVYSDKLKLQKRLKGCPRPMWSVAKLMQIRA